ncbi:MAG: methionyl-tRNA formyltransferase [Bacteroidaceae bacterium]|nr:methionyl-tRNA formyltransferase [Bacteroidaceae bacterium]
MKKEDLRIIYMGTPDFAVETLRLLVERGYNVVAVVTMPDKPAGRGHKIQFSPVKQYAISAGLPILQPERLKDENFIAELKSYNADLQIVVAFRMLPEVVWNMPPMGTFNLHASLLPQYRGAAPINWAVMNGDKETGITTFFLQHEIDTGKVIQQRSIPIAETDNVGDIHDRLMMLGAEMVCETVDNIIAGRVEAIPQEDMMTDEPLRPAPKIFKETCHLDFSRYVVDLYNQVRGLSPYPAAWCEFVSPDNERYGVKIFEASYRLCQHDKNPGSINTDGKKIIEIACEGGYLQLVSLQLAGKKRLLTEELLRGFRMTDQFVAE